MTPTLKPKLLLSFFLLLIMGGFTSAQSFVHPGCMSTQADIDRMKAKIAAGAEPWASAYAVLANNPHSSASYTANPLPIINRGGNFPQNYVYIMNDAAAAYQCALRWKLTGDSSFAEAAMRNMDGYSSTLTMIGGDTNSMLCKGAQGFQFACAAELLRDYQPWVDSGGFASFQVMLLEKFYEDPTNGSGLRGFLNSHNGTCYSHYWLNWEGFALSAAIAIGVVCDRQDIFDHAVNYYRTNGVGNGLATRAVHFMHPGYLGQSQEAGRDMGHASIDPVLFAQFAEVAWNQGEDIYGFNDNGILAMSEYTSRAMTTDGVPWVNYAGCDVNTTNVATGSNYRAGVDMIWNHYVNRRGLAAPYTTAAALANRPEGGGGNYGGNSGGFDQIGFTTLTHALDITTATTVPSALRADAPLANTARVWWYGSANATGYNVKRATTSGGPYTVVASNLSAKNFLYTDTCLTPGTTYYYVVSAIVNGAETANSQPVSVTANRRLSGAVIGTDAIIINGQGKYQLFDNAPVTWFDASAPSGAWAGLDLGTPHRLTKVGYYPRKTYANRMTGGQFQGSNSADFSSGVVTLLTIGSQPPEGTTTVQTISDTGTYRYVRYIGPDNGYCNAADLQFEGYPSPAVAPSAPANLSAVGDNAAVMLKWSAAGNTTSFTVKRATVSGGPYTIIASGVTSSVYNDTTPTNGVAYYYVVSGSNETGESANSAEVSTTPSANALAGSLVWTGTVGGVWDTTSLNWQKSSAQLAYQDGDRVLFDDSSGSNTWVNISAVRSPLAVTFNNGWRSYTLDGSAIHCTGALVKNGGGALFIPNANTFGGGAVLAGGRTTIQNVNSLGTGSLTLAGGTLSTYGDMTLAKDIAISGGGGLSLGSAANMTYAGTITGSGWLTLGNDSNYYSLNLSGTNNLTGGTVAVANNGNYVRFKTAAMGNGATDWVFNDTTAGRTTLEFATGTMVFGSLAGNGVLQGNVGGAMDVTLLVGGNNHSSTFSGVIHDNPTGTGSISLSKTGTGTQQLTGACDYSGATIVNGGNLTVSTVFAGKGSIQANAGTTLGVTNASSSSAKLTNLTLDAGSTLELNNVTNSLTPLLACNGNVVLNGACTVNVTQIPAGLRRGSYPLVSYTGSFQGTFSNLQLQLPSGVNGTLVNNSGQIALTITSVPAPPEPTGLTISLTDGQSALSWAGSQYADTYSVWRATTIGGPYTLVAQVMGTSYTDSGVPPFATYYYKVTAVNATGESAPTATVNTVRGAQVACLAFDENSGATAADSTGNGWNGILVNGPTWAAGRSGNAVDLDGTNDYASLPTGVLNGIGNFSVAAWVKLDSINMWSRIFDFGTGTPVNMFLTPCNGTSVPRFAITTGGGAGEQGINGTAGLPTGVWIHVAVTLKDGVGTLYVNGVAVGSNGAMTLTPSSLGATNKNYIGKSQYNDPYLNGRVDDFQLYNYALNASELGSLAGLAPDSAPTAPTGLTAASPSSNRINLAWTASAGATGYNIRRATTSGGPYVVIASNVTATGYSDDTVSPLTTYYVVSAVNGSGESVWSTEASARPGYLLLHLKLDETSGAAAADSSNNGRNATLVNGPAFASGRMGNALRFSASSSQYATLPAGLVSSLNDFTISTWVKPTTLANWARVFDFGSGTATNMFLTAQSGATGKPRFAIKINNSAEQILDAPNTLTTGVWTHIALTLSGSTATLYVNGVAAGTNTAMTFKPSGMGNTTQNYLGKSQYNDPYLNGALDDFRIYSIALSAGEIGILAAGELAAPQNLTAAPGASQIALSWDAVAGSTGYTVRRSLESGGTFTDLAAELPTTTYLNAGLADGTTWYYTVTATGLPGASAASGPVSATTYTAVESWRFSHFGTPSGSGNAGDSADPDGDGWSNDREFTAGTDPNDRASLLRMTQMQASGNAMLLHFPTVNGKIYRLERSDSLLEDSWTTVQADITGTGAEIEITDLDGAAGPRRFYRIIVLP